ncbi:MAG: hypothetical protein AAB336_04465 [Acidobacteriota bacterium]
MKNIRLTTLLIGLLIIGVSSTFAQIQPTQAKTDEMRKNGPCSDPWISWAYIDVSAGTDSVVGFGSYAQCNPKWYNNGSWNNYTELYNAVKEYRRSLSQAGISWNRIAQPNGTIAFIATVDGEKFGAIGKGLAIKDGKLIGTDSAGLVGNDGASMVAAGGGNMVAAGGGNMVAAGGGNVVPTAGGRYTLLSGERKRIKVGKNTYLVIKK